MSSFFCLHDVFSFQICGVFLSLYKQANSFVMDAIHLFSVVSGLNKSFFLPCFEALSYTNDFGVCSARKS